MDDKFYHQAILVSYPRLFSNLNQNPHSNSYGCFDREFWHYKVGKDFPSSIFQTGVLGLTLLYRNNFPGNIYFNNPGLLRLIKGGISFWAGLQQKDGTFSEWYPGERSHVATAFTSYAVSETILLLDKTLLEEEKNRVLVALRRAGDWLANHPDKMVSNHTAGAIVALYNLYLLTHKKEYKEAAEENLKTLLNLQSREGWFPEYGGADLGYLSLTVDFLAKYWQKSGDKNVLGPLEKAVNFMNFFIHPDGSFGGEYGSRGTKFLIPHGLEILSKNLPQARQILDQWFPFNSFDDRYLIFFFLNNWIQAYFERQKNLSGYQTTRKTEKEFSENFSEAGILVKKTKDYYLIFSYKKNGVLKLFREKRLVFSDTGWWGKLEDGRTISSQWLNPKQDNLSIQTEFCQVNEPILREKMILFRFFNYTLGQLGFFSNFFQWWLKRRYLISLNKVPVFLKRSLVIKGKNLVFEDEISLGKGVFLLSLCSTVNLCQKFTPTASFFTSQDLWEASPEDYAIILNKKRKIKVTKSL